MTPSRWGLTDRRPAVAGTFYPDRPDQIQDTLTHWCREAAGPAARWQAALVPHAGWVYSGQVAAQVLSRITPPRKVVALCPQHHPGGARCAVAPWQQWLFPGGSVPIDVPLSERLAEHVGAFQLDDRPHRQEHAIEVQLPLLAHFFPACQLVAITVGRLDLNECQQIATALASTLADQLDDTLLLISSDMNHFADDAENRRLDALALKTLDDLDPQQLYATCHQHHITMCGMLPAVIVLLALQALNRLSRAERVDYRTSAEASGVTQRVVGYAGMLFA